MMEVAAKLKGAKLSAQKARLVADQVRGKQVGEALDVLSFSTKKVHSWFVSCWSQQSRMPSTMKVLMSMSCASRKSLLTKRRR